MSAAASAGPKKVVAHPTTYDFCVQTLQLEHDIAHRVARTVPLEQVLLQQRIQDASGQSDEILRSNPGLLLLRNGDRETYLNNLYDARTRGVDTVSSLAFPDAARDDASPVDLVSRQIELPERYSDDGLLRAILMQGFRLGNARPLINMRYTDANRIRRESFKGLSGEQQRRFNETFANLIADGVILTMKEYKSGGGRFPGCYSVTSSLAAIKDDALRSFVRSCLYTRSST